MLVITAICVISTKNDETRRIKNFKVFLVTAAWSVFAYLWLYIVLVVFSPNEVAIWEAVLTLFFFLLVVLNSYAAQKNFFMSKLFPGTSNEEVEMNINDMCKFQLFSYLRVIFYLIKKVNKF